MHEDLPKDNESMVPKESRLYCLCGWVGEPNAIMVPMCPSCNRRLRIWEGSMDKHCQVFWGYGAPRLCTDDGCVCTCRPCQGARETGA